MPRVSLVSALVAVLFLAASANGQISTAARKAQILAMKTAAGRLKKFSKVLQLMDSGGSDSYVNFLLQILGVTRVTILLPTDAAWNKLPSSVKSKLSSNAKSRLQMFKFQTIKVQLSASQLASLKVGATFLTSHGSLLEKRAPPSSNRNAIVIGAPGRVAVKDFATISDRNIVTTLRISVQGIDTWLIPPGWS